ncbi:NAD-dependent protein deacetylase sirtuin-1 [Echinococcus granulosus]|uniref:NAD dependent deacetylase sirtuin 1 n=1 Tax=Echinococcus granulosus TaxID=6210 RepID=A0A068WT24_ECHGR|nr:NAD-dependent protein deacetylase sirtuin-1 [Echinococcus granulosus]CDS22978.1 NAD dependent deacetylase sirtuin 1 [Echinococcus granulosus]
MGDANGSSAKLASNGPHINLESSKESVDIVVVNDEEEECDSECEIVSVSSDIDEQEMKWRNVTRMNTLISAGYNNPRLLLTRIFGINPNILPSDNGSMWSILFSLLSETNNRKRLKQYSTIESVVQLLRESSHILVLTGAGISVSCGIPDFRSRDGVYARLARDFPDLHSPQDMFDLQYFLRNPNPFFNFAKELFPGQFKPSYAHRFIRLLERKSKLLRNYTQNIDTLEQVAGIKKVIQCHGSFATASCVSCGYKVRGEEIREAIMAQRIPHCPHCRPDLGLKGAPPVTGVGASTVTATTPDTSPSSSSSVHGVMKPDIVFFGEGLPAEFHESLHQDLREVDLVLVMGSSLKVRPVSHIPDSVPSKVPQILINRESLSNHNFDTELLGDCDVILEHLCRQLEWSVDEDSNGAPSVVQATASLTKVNVSIPLSAAVAALSSEVNVSTTHLKGSGDEKLTKSRRPGFSPNSVTGISVAVESGADKSTAQEAKGSPSTRESRSSEMESKNVTLDGANNFPVDVAGDNKPTLDGTSERPIDVDDFDSYSDLDSESSSSSSEDGKVAFNLSEYLPGNSFTTLPPNMYIFKGAEFSLSLEAASKCLQEQLQQSSRNPPVAAAESISSQSSSEDDRFMQQLLRRCELDSELQRHRADVVNGVATETETKEVEVIDCDSPPNEWISEKNKSSTSSLGVENANCNGREKKKTPPFTNSNPPDSKRRRCSDEEDDDGVIETPSADKPVDA